MTFRGWFATTALLAPAALASPGAGPAPATYEIDGVHSSVLFRIKHFDASFVYGRFNEVSGTLVYDEASPAASSVEVTIKADSVDTHNAGRDKHLKSPDFFNAEEFPVLSFKSKSVKGSGKGGGLEVTGDLTIHGVTKPVTVKGVHTGTGKGMKGEERAGFETTFTIKRSDFGMRFMAEALGDEVQITVALEGVKK
ncbi:MAG TPA: YceI family protein [Planctomycetota bacterium]|jgi:polyisoprenoid-binding protein YceI|nr:YceI family protein [Planctomycetota bacterium]